MAVEEVFSGVREVYAALQGRPVLLPIDLGKKGPFYDDWRDFSFEDTREFGFELKWSKKMDGGGREVYRTAAYDEELDRVKAEGGNLGVLLGSPSQFFVMGEEYHLCSIDIDTDEGAEEFLALNSWARNALQTRGARGRNVWVWTLKDSYPKLHKVHYEQLDGDGKKVPWGEWRATGGQTVIYGRHPDGVDYRRISEAEHPARIDFLDIVWPDNLDLPWEEKEDPYTRLKNEHGDPLIQVGGNTMLNSPFFAAQFAEEHPVLFEPDENRFYQYEDSDGEWKGRSESVLRVDFAKDLKTVAAAVQCPEILTKRSTGMLQSLVNMLKGFVEEKGVFEIKPGIVHLANCMLDLNTQPPEVKSFSRNYYSRNRIAIPFDERAECPTFVNQLLAPAMSESDQYMLQKWAGMVLLGVNLGQKIMVMTGTAGRGKSTVMNLISDVIGSQNVAALRTELLKERFEIFSFIGKTLLVGSDVHPTFLMTKGASVLKSLSGGDPLSAERKSGETFTIRGKFNIGITSNARLKVRQEGDSGAWGRRLMIIHVDAPKPERPDPLFKEKILQSEGSGVVNWAIQGAIDVLRDFRETGSFVMDTEQKDRVSAILAESDSINYFVEKGLTTTERDATITKEELLEAYFQYCEWHGWQPFDSGTAKGKLGDAILNFHRLSERNDIRREDKSKRGYKGLKAIEMEVDSE